MNLIPGAEVRLGCSRYVVLVFARDLTIEKITAGELAGALEVLPRQVRQVRQRPREAATRSGRVRPSVIVCARGLESRPTGRPSYDLSRRFAIDLSVRHRTTTVWLVACAVCQPAGERDSVGKRTGPQRLCWQCTHRSARTSARHARQGALESLEQAGAYWCLLRGIEPELVDVDGAWAAEVTRQGSKGGCLRCSTVAVRLKGVTTEP